MDNTAIPRYYAEFRDKVLSGEVIVNEKISLEMNRIDDLIRNPDIYYDEKKVEGFISFCESELTLTDGADLNLLDSFKLWGEQLYGWYYIVDKAVYVPDQNGGSYQKRQRFKRLKSKQYLIVGRGAAKSLYLECVQGYELTCSGETTHQITTAPTMKQAEEVIGPLRTAITRKRGPLFKFLTDPNLTKESLVSTKRGIENKITNSILEIRPMSIDKLQGLRPKISTVDEWLSGDVREDVAGAIEQGASKLDEYCIVLSSSEGTVRNGSGDTIKLELETILRGEYDAINTSIFWYCLDNIDEVDDPLMWQKANPNIGITVSYEAYARDVERMENAPSTRNDILAKRFGIPMEGFTYFFTYEETVCHGKVNFDGLPCSLGCDLSRGDDFCAFTWMFPIDDWFGVKTLAFISETTLHKLPGAMRMKYQEFIDEGSLIVMDGSILDMDLVYDELDRHNIDHDYDIRSMGYDPYNAKGFVERWELENSAFGVTKVQQGSRTESVPLGELKALAEDGKLIHDQKIMEFAMGNAVTIADTNGNRKLYKLRQDKKIDNVAAMVDAMVAYKENKTQY